MLIALDRYLHEKYKSIDRSLRLRRYLRSGRLPFVPGYWDYRDDFVARVLQDVDLFGRFKSKQALPDGYGVGLDERVVEYPWVISRLRDGETRLLDAGSTLNFPFLLELPILSKKSIIIYTLAPEKTHGKANVSYVYGDLRHMILGDGMFDEIVCISTLEHVGMDNTLIYTKDQRFNESRPFDYRGVLHEFHRLLAPGGRLLLTVPYGKYQNHGWLQQFDAMLLEDVRRVFDGKSEDDTFYRYTPNGWVVSNADDCANCEYSNFQARSSFDPDSAAAARAVASLMLVK